MPPKVSFAVTPYRAADKLRREYKAFIDYLSRSLDTKVRLVIPTSYRETARLIASSRVDFALLAPLAYVEAEAQNPKVKLLATYIADGTTTYGAYLVARNDSDLRRVTDLRGKSVGFVDRFSTSGYVYPVAMFSEAGIHVPSDLARMEFLGSHDAVIQAVLDGTVDAGATYSAAFASAQERLPEKERLRVVGKAGRIPYDAICASPELNVALAEKMRTVLLALTSHTPQGEAVLPQGTGINGFVRGEDEHYDNVREVVAKTPAAKGILDTRRATD